MIKKLFSYLCFFSFSISFHKQNRSLFTQYFTYTPRSTNPTLDPGRILQDPIIRQNPIGFLVMDSDNILLGKCQMLQILRAIVLAILEKSLFDPSDQTIRSNIQSDRIRLRRLGIGFRHQESNRILSDYRIPYDPTQVPIGSNIGTDRMRHRIRRPVLVKLAPSLA